MSVFCKSQYFVSTEHNGGRPDGVPGGGAGAICDKQLACKQCRLSLFIIGDKGLLLKYRNGTYTISLSWNLNV